MDGWKQGESLCLVCAISLKASTPPHTHTHTHTLFHPLLHVSLFRVYFTFWVIQWTLNTVVSVIRITEAAEMKKDLIGYASRWPPHTHTHIHTHTHTALMTQSCVLVQFLSHFMLTSILLPQCGTLNFARRRFCLTCDCSRGGQHDIKHDNTCTYTKVLL